MSVALKILGKTAENAHIDRVIDLDLEMVTNSR